MSTLIDYVAIDFNDISNSGTLKSVGKDICDAFMCVITHLKVLQETNYVLVSENRLSRLGGICF